MKPVNQELEGDSSRWDEGRWIEPDEVLDETPPAVADNATNETRAVFWAERNGFRRCDCGSEDGLIHCGWWFKDDKAYVASDLVELFDASHLSQSDTDTAKTSNQWPSIEEQLEYWKTHDHGGNVIPSRIEANEERYDDLS